MWVFTAKNRWAKRKFQISFSVSKCFKHAVLTSCTENGMTLAVGTWSYGHCTKTAQLLWDCQRHLDHWEHRWSKELDFFFFFFFLSGTYLVHWKKQMFQIMLQKFFSLFCSEFWTLGVSKAGEATVVLHSRQICAGCVCPYFCHGAEFQLEKHQAFLFFWRSYWTLNRKSMKKCTPTAASSLLFWMKRDEMTTTEKLHGWKLRWAIRSWPRAMQRLLGVFLVTFLTTGMGRSCSDSKAQKDVMNLTCQKVTKFFFF